LSLRELEDRPFTRYRFVVPKRRRGSYLVTDENGEVKWQVLAGRRSQLRICDATGAELARLQPKPHHFGWLPGQITGLELYRDDGQQASIRESGGEFSDRFSAALSDGTETMIEWDGDEQRYTIVQAGRSVARLDVQDRWFRRQKYVLELSSEADAVLIIATCVVINRAHSSRHIPGA
jgi:uncharacterized protein YxjI